MYVTFVAAITPKQNTAIAKQTIATDKHIFSFFIITYPLSDIVSTKYTTILQYNDTSQSGVSQTKYNTKWYKITNEYIGNYRQKSKKFF